MLSTENDLALTAGERVPLRTAIRHWLTQVPWQVAGLIIISAVVYAPVIQFQFLNWDDSWYIVWNDLIKSWHPANLYRILTEPVARNFAPATIGMFLVEHSVWQLWPGGYHVTNLLLHMINGILVLQLLRQLTKNEWLAWTVAALFVVHPVQVESVAWISSRKTLLSATWTLASCLCWLKPDRTNRDEGWGLFWLLLALASKASAVVLPPIVLAYDVLIARKSFSASVARQLIPTFFCVMLILITMNAQVTIIGGLRGHIGMSKWRLLAIDSTLLWRYVGMLIYPQDLCVLYDPPVVGITLIIVIAIIAWVAVSGLLWKFRHWQPLATFAGIVWFLLFVPVLNLFPLTTLMNDRYLYLPCIPFFALMVGGIQYLWKTASIWRPQWTRGGPVLGAIGSAALIGYMAWGTLGYLPVWKDPVSLWSYARVKAPEITVVQIQWAITLRDLGRTDEAVAELKNILDRGNADEAEAALIRSLIEKIKGQKPVESAGNSVSMLKLDSVPPQ